MHQLLINRFSGSIIKWVYRERFILFKYFKIKVCRVKGNILQSMKTILKGDILISMVIKVNQDSNNLIVIV